MSFLNLFGIANAYAQTAGARPSAGQGFMSMLPMLVILIGFMYFLIIRPQSKRAKEHNQLIANLKKGDEVVTSGGLLGKINKIADNFISLEIADNVEITIQKSAIGTSVPKGTMKSI
jgi:preprotein translocase subunit YajC